MANIYEDAPTLAQLEAELAKENRKMRFGKVLRSTIFILIAVAAITAVLVLLYMPVLSVYGDSMEPTLSADDSVVAFKQKEYRQGDVIVFYYNNNMLIKRIVAMGGDVVDLKEDGTVMVNGYALLEHYIPASEKAYGTSDLEYPFTVPDGTYFVMGDHRTISIDSRSSQIGCVENKDIAGKIILKVWPAQSIGFVY